MRVASWVLGALLLLVLPARAQVETTFTPALSGADWSATAGRTAGAGNAVLQAEAGWPGIGFTYLRGMDDVTDVGLHVAFNYGFENTANSIVGFNLAVPYRRTLGDAAGATFAFETQPGLSIYGNHGAMVGVGGPIGIVAGWKATPQLTLDVGADVPVLISFTHPTGFVVGPQFGGGGEYLIDRNLAVTARIRVGPSFSLDSSGTSSQTGFLTLIGLAYNAR